VLCCAADFEERFRFLLFSLSSFPLKKTVNVFF
jgi:hypothetical protein